jgi:uncharacterized membrane protein YheB (UPF0754 family)
MYNYIQRQRFWSGETVWNWSFVAGRFFEIDRRNIMSTISLRLPESLHKKLRELAKAEGISINQLAASAMGEKVASLMTEQYLEERAKLGSRGRFKKALAKVRSVEPDEQDRL